MMSGNAQYLPWRSEPMKMDTPIPNQSDEPWFPTSVQGSFVSSTTLAPTSNAPYQDKAPYPLMTRAFSPSTTEHPTKTIPAHVAPSPTASACGDCEDEDPFQASLDALAPDHAALDGLGAFPIVDLSEFENFAETFEIDFNVIDDMMNHWHEHVAAKDAAKGPAPAPSPVGAAAVPSRPVSECLAMDYDPMNDDFEAFATSAKLRRPAKITLSDPGAKPTVSGGVAKKSKKSANLAAKVPKLLAEIRRSTEPLLLPSPTAKDAEAEPVTSRRKDRSTGSLERAERAAAFRGDPPAKPKRKYVKVAPADIIAKEERICAHCGLTKSPQWRSGPEEWGLKAYAALCNTCGVKFRNGRLQPEYKFKPEDRPRESDSA